MGNGRRERGKRGDRVPLPMLLPPPPPPSTIHHHHPPSTKIPGTDPLSVALKVGIDQTLWAPVFMTMFFSYMGLFDMAVGRGVWCGVVWCGVKRCAVLRCAALCGAVRCGAVRCCAVLCCQALCCAVL